MFSCLVIFLKSCMFNCPQSIKLPWSVISHSKWYCWNSYLPQRLMIYFSKETAVSIYPRISGKLDIVFTNLTKVNPLCTLSHRGSDNSPLQIVFKWTLYELCLCIYYVMISTNQIAYFKRSAVFLNMTKSLSLLSVA